MRSFLNDYITSLPSQSTVRASTMLRQAALEKEQIGILMQRLTQGASLGRVGFNEIDARPGAFVKISGSNFLINFRELTLRMDLFYRLSSEISELLNSETTTVLSEIRQLEQELEDIEKSIDNYAFLLSDGNAFDFGFMEPFTDEIHKATDIDFPISDRGGLYFLDEEKATINRDEGVLTLAPITSTEIPFFPIVTVSNFLPQAPISEGIQNLMLKEPNSAWRVSISSEIPITNDIPQIAGTHDIANHNGAQAVLELYAQQAAACDFIKVTPLSGSSMDIVQIITYADADDSDPVELLDEVLSIDKATTLFFSTRPISKVKIYLKQGTYHRHNREPVSSERLYRKTFASYRGRSSYGGSRKNFKIRNIDGVSQVFVKNFLRKERKLKPLSVRVSNKRLGLMRWGPMDARAGISRDTEMLSTRPNWFEKSEMDTLAKAAYDNKQFGELLKPGAFPKRNETSKRVNPNYEYMPAYSSTSKLRSTQITNGTNGSLLGRINKLSSIENKSSGLYNYSFGLSNISIGIKASLEKGVFISKQLPSSGDIIELKIKESHVNAKALDDVSLDTSIASSVEYSVTNVARPFLEEHWLPVLPANQQSITSERIFLDDKGKAFFRFPADRTEGITLYKNNRIFPLEGTDLIYSEGEISIVGFILDIPLFSPIDIFTVDYIPYGDANLIDFQRQSSSDTPLIVSHDDDGAGEGFSSVGGQLTILLKNHPFLDYDQIDSSTYNATTGLTPYTPITIVMNDGTNAINLTNYKGGVQSSLDSTSSSTQFIHRDRTLLFNKTIASSFRVFYEYLPNNTRVRTVLRSNLQTGLVSPKVDFVQVKAKTRVANAGDNS